jgi:hypothetical protein
MEGEVMVQPVLNGVTDWGYGLPIRHKSRRVLDE